MTPRKKVLPTFNAVSSGQTATCDLPVGALYHGIELNAGDANGLVIGSLITEIRVKLNGKVQRVHTPAQLNAMNGVNGADFLFKTSGTLGNSAYRTYLPIFFAEPWRDDRAQRKAGTWNVTAEDVRSFQLEVDFAAVTTPVISGSYWYEPPRSGGIGLIQKVIQQTQAAVGTVQDFNTLDRRDLLQAIHLFATTDATPRYVNKLKLTANGVEIQDLITTLENQAILLWNEMNPDTSATPRFDLILDLDDGIDSWLPLNGLSELTVHVEYNLSAAANMVMLIVRVGPPE